MSLTRLRFDFFKQDISAGFVVFLVALPLCLGIAVASEAPPISGIIAGVVAGILVSYLSGSELSVSGPAAGLTVTVIAARHDIGGLEGLLVATILSGLFQIAFGTVRAGLLATFFPSAVIKGMLAGIGTIIAFKQLPHAIGWKSPFNPEEGMFCFVSPFCLKGLWSQLITSSDSFNVAAVIISGVSVCILVIWPSLSARLGGLLRAIPAPLFVVCFGVAFNLILQAVLPSLALSEAAGQLVSLPEISGFSDLLSHGIGEHWWSWLAHSEVWSAALVIALIGSVETLLSLEAVDKLDPLRRASRPNRELVAQGIGNITSGALGGLPMTSVIVRSSTNVYAGGKTRISGMVHGVLLLLSVIVFPRLLNQIPLAALSAILIVVGYKLANITLIRDVWRSGLDQFLPFIFTALCVVLFDLLTGVFVGTVFGLMVVLVMNHHSAFSLVNDGRCYLLRFAKDVTFLQKIALKRTLAQLPNDSEVVIDCGGAMFVDHDIIELIQDFMESAIDRHIKVDVTNLPRTRFNLLSAITQRSTHG
jgi:MFS superfamily sulfate permease-like transporter